MDKPITISKKDLITAEASVLAEMALERNEVLLIMAVLTDFSSRLVKKLFDEKED